MASGTPNRKPSRSRHPMDRPNQAGVKSVASVHHRDWVVPTDGVSKPLIHLRNYFNEIEKLFCIA